ncbi:MAG TPA: hypothetical protein VGF37_00835 [Chthoniobacterales bacterium]|jgi:hypothetical protein
MAQDVKSLLRVIDSASQGQVEAYASLVLSLEKRFIFFFGFMRLENDNQLFNGFRCPDDSGKVFHYHSLSNAVWNDEPANPFITGNMPGKGTQKIEVGLKPISGRIVGTLLDAELADHISRNLYDRDYATAEWLVEQGVPFYKEITRGSIKILIPSQLPALPPGWKRPS